MDCPTGILELDWKKGGAIEELYRVRFREMQMILFFAPKQSVRDTMGQTWFNVQQSLLYYSCIGLVKIKVSLNINNNIKPTPIL